MARTRGVKRTATERGGSTGAGRRLRLLAAVAAITIVGCGLAAGTASAAGAVDVFVGYADSLRANAANFPTPWDGSPGVTYRGCSGSSCNFDASAVRIVNNSSVSQVVNSVQVSFGSCKLNLWPGAKTLAPGGQLIVTQTATNPVENCDASSGSIDGSEINATTCQTNDGLIPVVDVTVRGQTTSFDDSGQVLNAGGGDPGCRNINESRQWTLIGSTPCNGATLVLAPAQQSRRISATARVAATFANGCGTGLASVRVALVANGPAGKRVSRAVTNSLGIANFTVTSSKLGTDKLFAGINNPAGVIFSNLAQIAWGSGTQYRAQAFAASVAYAKHRPNVFDASNLGWLSSAKHRVKKFARVSYRQLQARGFKSDTRIRRGSASAKTSLSRVTIVFRGLPVIQASSVTSFTQSTCSRSSGYARIRSLKIGSKRINVRHLRRNTVIRLGHGQTLTLNQQRRIRGLTTGLVVYAMRLHLPHRADVIVGSVTSGTRYC